MNDTHKNILEGIYVQFTFQSIRDAAPVDVALMAHQAFFDVGIFNLMRDAFDKYDITGLVQDVRRVTCDEKRCAQNRNESCLALFDIDMNEFPEFFRPIMQQYLDALPIIYKVNHDQVLEVKEDSILLKNGSIIDRHDVVMASANPLEHPDDKATYTYVCGERKGLLSLTSRGPITYDETVTYIQTLSDDEVTRVVQKAPQFIVEDIMNPYRFICEGLNDQVTEQNYPFLKKILQNLRNHKIDSGLNVLLIKIIHQFNATKKFNGMLSPKEGETYPKYMKRVLDAVVQNLFLAVNNRSTTTTDEKLPRTEWLGQFRLGDFSQFKKAEELWLENRKKNAESKVADSKTDSTAELMGKELFDLDARDEFGKTALFYALKYEDHAFAARLSALYGAEWGQWRVAREDIYRALIAPRDCRIPLWGDVLRKDVEQYFFNLDLGLPVENFKKFRQNYHQLSEYIDELVGKSYKKSFDEIKKHGESLKNYFSNINVIDEKTMKPQEAKFHQAIKEAVMRFSAKIDICVNKKVIKQEAKEELDAEFNNFKQSYQYAIDLYEVTKRYKQGSWGKFFTRFAGSDPNPILMQINAQILQSYTDEKGMGKTFDQVHKQTIADLEYFVRWKNNKKGHVSLGGKRQSTLAGLIKSLFLKSRITKPEDLPPVSEWLIKLTDETSKTKNKAPDLKAQHAP